MNCYKCNTSNNTVEASGRDNRILFLKESYKSAASNRAKLSERIMDEIDSEQFYMCEECLICPMCFIETPVDVCVICTAPACHNCSVPAVEIMPDGSYSVTENIVCTKCSPPSGGKPEEYIIPTRDPVLQLC